MYQKNILKDVLSEERSAVMLEMLTTFDEKLYAEGLREEGREKGLAEGRIEGRAEGREEIIVGAYKNGNSPEQIAVFIGVPLYEVQQIIDSYKALQK